MMTTIVAMAASLMLQCPSGEEPVFVIGKGVSTNRITLERGLYTVTATVRGNSNRDLDEMRALLAELDMPDIGGSGDNFVARLESPDSQFPELLVNEIATRGTWETTFRVGGWMSALKPGRQIVSVDASGSWRLDFCRE